MLGGHDDRIAAGAGAGQGAVLAILEDRGFPRLQAELFAAGEIDGRVGLALLDLVRRLEHLEPPANPQAVDNDLHELPLRPRADGQAKPLGKDIEDVKEAGHGSGLVPVLLLHGGVSDLQRLFRSERQPELVDEQAYALLRLQTHHFLPCIEAEFFAVAPRHVLLDLHVQPLAVDHQAVHIEDQGPQNSPLGWCRHRMNQLSTKPRPARSVELTHGLLHRLQDLSTLDDLFELVDVPVERPVLLEMSAVPADRFVGRPDAFSRLERRAKVDRLGAGQELDGDHGLGVVYDLAGLERRRPTHADKILLVGGRRDRPRGRGVREDAVLADERARRILREHHPREHPRALRQEGRQAGVQVRVHQPVEPPLGDDGHGGHRRPQELEGQGLGRPLEVRTRQHELLVGKEDGVIGGVVELDLDHGARPLKRVAGRADDLGRAPQAVGVLHFLLAQPGQDLASLGLLYS